MTDHMVLKYKCHRCGLEAHQPFTSCYCTLGTITLPLKTISQDGITTNGYTNSWEILLDAQIESWKVWLRDKAGLDKDSDI